MHVDDYNRLGELQADFQSFTQKLTELGSFLYGGFYLQKRRLLLDDLNDLRDMEKNLVEQKVLQKQDFGLGQDEFNVQEKLHLGKVISSLEFRREKAKLLAREMPLKNLDASLIRNGSSQTAKHKEILELDNSIMEHRHDFQQSLQTLLSSLETWKQRYILTAPVAGRISFSAPLQDQQHAAAGQELLTVEPAKSHYRGLLRLAHANLGKLVVGQNVMIKLDGYPYRQYGVVEGKLAKISSIPGKDSVYWGYVDLPHQLTTRYNKQLSYRSGLKGQAEIVTQDQRVIERLVSVVRNGQ